MVKFTQEKMSCVWLLWTCTKRPQQGTNTEMHIAHIQPYPLPPDAKVTPPQAGQPLGSPDAVRLLSSLLHRNACTFLFTSASGGSGNRLKNNMLVPVSE